MGNYDYAMDYGVLQCLLFCFFACSVVTCVSLAKQHHSSCAKFGRLQLGLWVRSLCSFAFAGDARVKDERKDKKTAVGEIFFHVLCARVVASYRTLCIDFDNGAQGERVSIGRPRSCFVRCVPLNLFVLWIKRFGYGYFAASCQFMWK